jgi:hypothetical protein
VLRDLISRLTASPAGFVLASRFTSRVHRLLRDAPSRFEVVHVPPMSTPEVQAFALRFDGGRLRRPGVAGGSGRRAHGRSRRLRASAARRPWHQWVRPPTRSPRSRRCSRPKAASRRGCRESYEFRLHRARGYGALKAILGILADDEPQNLTEIAHHLQRTPGSTKDYLSWLEDVDVISMHGKRYSYNDPLVRLVRPAPRQGRTSHRRGHRS